MTRRIRIGLAGLGRMGQIHAASLSGQCPSAQLACVFDADEGAARSVGEQFGVPAASSYDDMLAGGTVDAVAVATPTGTHAELVVRACRAGKHTRAASSWTSPSMTWTRRGGESVRSWR